MSNHQEQISIWMEHVRYLSQEIGPRGPTTEAEQRGAQYCSQILQELGYHVEIDHFQSALSIFLPHLYTAIALLVAFVVYPLAGRISAFVAFLIALIALVSDVLELSFRNNLWRMLVPKGKSQNVIAKLEPAGNHRRDLILIGHVDSQRTPLIFKNKRWLSAYQTFTTVAFVAFVAQVILYGIGAFTQWEWIWPLSGVSAVAALLLAAMCLQADRTPFTHGANDNASAVGLVLALARRFKAEPLRETRLWFVCTGCEEVQHYGAIDFFRRHHGEFKNPHVLVFEMLGCAGPAWLTREGIVIPFHADKFMRSLAEAVSQEHPELKAYPARITGGNTEMADALRVGIPAITIMGLGPKGEAPYWHRREDTFDKMDREVMTRCYEFVWHFIHALDSSRLKSKSG